MGAGKICLVNCHKSFQAFLLHLTLASWRAMQNWTKRLTYKFFLIILEKNWTLSSTVWHFYTLPLVLWHNTNANYLPPYLCDKIYEFFLKHFLINSTSLRSNIFAKAEKRKQMKHVEQTLLVRK
jgi:hypothetical protein